MFCHSLCLRPPLHDAIHENSLAVDTSAETSFLPGHTGYIMGKRTLVFLYEKDGLIIHFQIWVPFSNMSHLKVRAGPMDLRKRGHVKISVNPERKKKYRVTQLVIDIHSIRAGNIVTWLRGNHVSPSTYISLKSKFSITRGEMAGKPRHK